MTHKIQIDDVVRDATPEESAVIDLIHDEAASQAQAEADKIAARAAALAKLEALGLTADEVAALVG